jgi:hypothetical protein
MRPETPSRVESGSERVTSGGSGEGHAAAGRAGAANGGTPEAPLEPVPRHQHTGRLNYGLALRNVCRAGFAGRGTTFA